MSSEHWKLEKDLCRCCHSEGSFINLAEPRISTGITKIYGDMLKECYDIDMVPVPGMLCMTTYTICEACIIRLQDAVDFKQQVLKCEERFKEMYNKDFITVHLPAVSVEVKQESPDSDPDDNKDDLPVIDDDDDDDKSMNLIINEDVDDVKPLEIEVEKKRKYKTKKPMKNQTCKKTKQQKTQKTAEEENDAEKKTDRVVAPKISIKENDDFIKKGGKYQCLKCKRTMKTIDSITSHLESQHYKIKKYKCPVCIERFISLALFTKHKFEVHNIDDRFHCTACNKVFNLKKNLNKHIKHFHMLGEVGQRLKCEFCDYDTFYYPAMLKHKVRHKTVKEYHCRFCKKSFLRKSTLTCHEKIHTGDKTKVCEECGEKFVQKASLNYHMAKYHPEVKF